MKRKVKKYDGEDGSLVSSDIEDESDRGSMTPEQQANSDAVNAAVKKPSFKEAFASARAGGDKTFTWNGKSYTTELASSKPTQKSYPGQGRRASVVTLPKTTVGKPGTWKSMAQDDSYTTYKKGGAVRSPASKRADGIATKGHTKGRYL
jgi:hypothetical protein